MRGADYYRELYLRHYRDPEVLEREKKLEECRKAELILQDTLLSSFQNGRTTGYVDLYDPLSVVTPRGLDCAKARLREYEGVSVREERFHKEDASGTRVIIEYKHE